MILQDYPENGLLCSLCREPQHESPGGAVCGNGHGGAPGVEGVRPASASATLTRLDDILNEVEACGMLDDLKECCLHSTTIPDFVSAVRIMNLKQQLSRQGR
jgi:hypothetical protein